MAGEFVVGAVFTLNAAPAISALESIGRAFETLDKALEASVGLTTTAVDRMVAQISRVGEAWRVAASEAGGARGLGGAGGRGGGRGGGPTDDERETERQLREDRLNAEAENRNLDQIYRRDHAAAVRENMDRDRIAALDDGITIPRPPRTGITEFRRSQPPLPPRNEFVFGDEDEEAVAKGGRSRSKAGGNRGDDIIQTIVDYELLHMAFKQAGGEQQSLFRGAKAFGIDPTSPEGEAAMAKLRASARQAAAGVAYTESQLAAGIPLIFGPMGLGPDEIDKATNIYPYAARAAEGLELLDPSNRFAASLPAMVEYAHESRRYEPEQLKRSYDILGAITSMVPHTTFAAEAGAMSYVVPLAKAAGIPPDEAAILVGTLQQAGLRGTIGATTLRQELLRLAVGGEDVLPKTQHSASLRGLTRQFEHALNLTPEGHEESAKLKGPVFKRMMEQIGLIDASGHRMYEYTAEDEKAGLGEKGGINVNRANEIFRKWAMGGASKADQLAAASLIYGVRGDLAPTVLAAVLQEGEPDYAEKFRSTVLTRADAPGGGFLEAARAQMSQTANQQSGQITARFNDILGHVADQTLPAFQGAMEKGLIPLLTKLGTLTAPDEAGNYTIPQKIAGFSTVGALAGGLVGGVLGFFGGGGVGAIPGAALGMAYGASIGAGGSAGYLYGDKITNFFSPETSGGPFDLTTPRPGLQPRTTPNVGLPTTPAAAANINITLGPISMSGIADETTFQNLLTRMTNSLKAAMSTAASIPLGTDQSAYTYPGWTP